MRIASAMLIMAGCVAALAACQDGSGSAASNGLKVPSQAGSKVAQSPASWDAVAAIEKRIGARIGAVLIAPDGTILAGHRADERFRLCSTYKLPLAAFVLARVDAGALALDQTVPITAIDKAGRSDLLRAMAVGETVSIARLAQAMVAQSDNPSAAILAAQAGGIDAFGAALAAWGDKVTRLAPVSPPDAAKGISLAAADSDVTSPAAIGALTHRLINGQLLSDSSRAILRQWMHEATTGTQRLRNGLPDGWYSGDKTGTCGSAFNDIAYFISDGKTSDQAAVLSVYIDGKIDDQAVLEGAMAEIARSAAQRVR